MESGWIACKQWAVGLIPAYASANERLQIVRQSWTCQFVLGVLSGLVILIFAVEMIEVAITTLGIMNPY